MLLGRLWCQRRDMRSSFLVRHVKSKGMLFDDHRCFSSVHYFADGVCLCSRLKMAIASLAALNGAKDPPLGTRRRKIQNSTLVLNPNTTAR